MANTVTHQGPHPEHGGLETHVGTREQCSGPDCGPLDPEDEIREAVLDLDQVLDDPEAAGLTLIDPRDPETGRLLVGLLHEIAESMQSDALTPVQEAARKLAHQINNRP